MSCDLNADVWSIGVCALLANVGMNGKSPGNELCPLIALIFVATWPFYPGSPL